MNQTVIVDTYINKGTKLHTDGLAPRHDAQLLALAREMFGSIKRHMLQEVSQATLARFLQDGAHTLGYIEAGKSCLLGIMANVVSK